MFTCTESLRRHLEINFPEVICFFSYGKFVIVYSADTNPCQHTVSTLKGTGLRNRDLMYVCIYFTIIKRAIKITNKYRSKNVNNEKNNNC